MSSGPDPKSEPSAPKRSVLVPSRRSVLIGSAAALAMTSIPASVVLKQPTAKVVGFRVPTYDQDLVAVLREGLRGFPAIVARAKGGRVVLKPNLVEVHAGRPVNTDPRLITAAAAAFLEAGAREVIVAEGPGHTRDTEAILAFTGLDELLRPLGVRYVDLNVDDGPDVPLAANKTKLGQLPIAQTIMGADLVVSMPKMKTHHWAGATLGMKNLFGTVPSAIVGWPKNPLHWAGVNASIVDLWNAIRPGFVIVDGIVGMEGDGPIMGTAVEHGVLLMGDQAPAVDATAMRLMGLAPWRAPFLLDALDVGATIAEMRIERGGDVLPIHRYAVLDHFSWLQG